MSFKHITVDQVRKELVDIIERYPDRTGGDPDEYNEKACVYYKDATGCPVSNSEFDGMPLVDDPALLVTPVCIIGQWVEDFHPELKQDEDFQYVLFRNSVFSTSTEVARLFDQEVVDLLGEVQSQQDDNDKTWKDIAF